MAAVCVDGSRFERDALVETIRSRVGFGSTAVASTTLAMSSTQLTVIFSPLYVTCALLYAALGCHW